jgi:acetylornithine deacetylase/succinyl-diaminopimelate desuccinylase-like protein
MIENISSSGGFEDMNRLLNKNETNDILDNMGDEAKIFDALLHNTAVPTKLEAGEQMNIVPSEATMGLDCRLLPGQTSDDLQRELRNVVPEDIDYSFNIVHYDEFESLNDRTLYPLLENILESSVEEGKTFPLVSWGGTDGRFLSKVGIQSYGFTPMNLPPDVDFFSQIHGADERVPVDAIDFGSKRLFEVIMKYNAYLDGNTE